jgi:hypothetical protein
MHVRSFACAVSAVALLAVAGPAAVAQAGTADPCDGKLLAYFKADDAAQSAQAGLTAAQQALDGADAAQKVLQSADAAIREGVLALPWTKASLPAQLNLGQAVRAYKSLYIKDLYGGSAATAANDPSAAAQNLAGAAQKLVDDAKLGKDQATVFVVKRLTQGASDLKAAYPLFVTAAARKADVAQATEQVDTMQSSISVARTALETCLQNAAGSS